MRPGRATLVSSTEARTSPKYREHIRPLFSLQSRAGYTYVGYFTRYRLARRRCAKNNAPLKENEVIAEQSTQFDTAILQTDAALVLKPRDNFVETVRLHERLGMSTQCTKRELNVSKDLYES